MRQLIDEVKDVPLAQGFDEVFYPGEVEDRAEAANLAAGGVVLAEQSLADLRDLGAETGVPFPEEAADDRRPEPAEDVSKADLVHRRLKEEIELGELAPGTPLSELSLVERTGASRTPVREALRRLAAEGLVDLVPAAGCPGVAGLAAERPRPVRLPRHCSSRPRCGRRPRPRRPTPRCAGRSPRCAPSSPASSAAPRRRPGRGPSTSWPTGSTGRSSAPPRNEHLRRTIAELRPHTARLRNLSHVDPQRVEVSVAEHLRMCDALLAGDADEAAAAIAEHLAQSLRDDLPQPRPRARRRPRLSLRLTKSLEGPQ